MGKIISAYMVPHPPIIVPGVGKGREKKAIKTIEAMRKVAKEVAKDKPSTIILSSPHAPFLKDYAYLEDAEVLSGNFNDFGYFDEALCFNNNHELANLIVEKAKRRGIQAGSLTKEEKNRFRVSPDLDHGTLVPLYYISKELPDFNFLMAEEAEIILNEGLYHIGKANVIRMVAEKK